MNLSDSRREEQAGECRISSEMWQREFGKTPSCRKSSEMRQEKTVGLRSNTLEFSDLSNLKRDETSEERGSVLRLERGGHPHTFSTERNSRHRDSKSKRKCG